MSKLEKQTQEAKKELDRTREGTNAVYARYKYEGLFEILENYRNNFQNLVEKMSNKKATPDENTPL